MRFQAGDQVTIKDPEFPIEGGVKTIEFPVYRHYDYAVAMGYDIIFGYNDDELEPA